MNYTELIESDWEDSEFRSILERKFFFVCYQFEGEKLILRKVKFWNMPYRDLNEVKDVWEKMVNLIKSGKIVKEVTNKGVRKTFFPKKTENRVSHVRPHAKNSEDTYKLPVPDKKTGLTEYTKHCFWLNADYIRDEIFLK
jgi:DNA mismatch repair protein MutH